MSTTGTARSVRRRSRRGRGTRRAAADGARRARAGAAGTAAPAARGWRARRAAGTGCRRGVVHGTARGPGRVAAASSKRTGRPTSATIVSFGAVPVEGVGLSIRVRRALAGALEALVDDRDGERRRGG